MENKKLPSFLRPLLWSFRWDDIDIEKDKEDIIVNTINEGTLDQWRWIIKVYGREAIRRILETRMETEFHPESRNLAKAMFLLSHFRHARRSSH